MTYTYFGTFSKMVDNKYFHTYTMIAELKKWMITRKNL